MHCANPYVNNGRAYGCGQCMPCRYNRRRIWMHRIMLEAEQYERNAFLTLTYADEYLPPGGSVHPEHLQSFVKRLRGRVSPERFRFFGVGEYGDSSWRPHYHVALFNFESCRWGQSRYSRSRTRCCDRCELVRETWRVGNVYLGTLEDDSAGYLAGYVTKKMTSADDPRLGGRHPEFTRQSLKPGIGKDALWEVASVLLQYELDEKLADVPAALRHAGRVLPLGRYLRGKLREMIGRDDCAPEEVLQKIEEELRPLREAARASKDDPSFKSHLIKSGEQVRRNMSSRAKLYGSRRSI